MKRRLIDQDPQREGRRQRRLLGILERRFAASIRKEILRASTVMIDAVRLSRSTPHLQDDHAVNIGKLYRRMATASAMLFGERFNTGSKGLEVKGLTREFFFRIIDEYLREETLAESIARVSAQTVKIISDQLIRGNHEGLGLAEIADGMAKSAPSISRARASVISRTETHSASTFAADQSARALGLPLLKEWVPVDDARTRDFGEGDGVVDQYSHRAMKGVTVPMDQPFNVPKKDGTFEEMMRPGDKRGSPGNTINCRCVLSYVIDEGA